MYVKIGTTEYKTIRNLRFSPYVDVTCQQIQTNEFSVDIVTNDNISTGAKAELYDDDDTLWASYWIYECYITANHVWSVTARDATWMLDARTMYQSLYTNELVSVVIGRILKDITDRYGANAYSLDSAFASTTISGYLPQGSARDRLQYVCFSIGAYVNTVFTDRLEIKKLTVPAEVPEIDEDDVFYKPITTYEKIISGIRLSYYKFIEIQKDDNVDWIEVNGKYYQAIEGEVFVSNPDADSAYGQNEIAISGIGIMDENNVASIEQRLEDIYFNNTSVSFDALNNGDYLPGEIYDTPTEGDGFILSADFKFGNAQRSTLNIKITSSITKKSVTFNRMYNNNLLGSLDMSVNQNAVVTYKNPYEEYMYTIGGVPVTRYVLYPANDYTSTPAGTHESVTMLVSYNVAFSFTYPMFGGILTVNQVDNLSYDSSEKILEI